MTRTDAIEIIVAKIFEVRGKKVMLDSDLADLYGVTAKRLNEQVRRNIKRFPEDFMYILTSKEFANLRSQIATSRWGGRRYRPYAFTQEGVAMLSSVLNSERAIRVNIHIMRAFVEIRKMLMTNSDLRSKIEEMERKYDKQFAFVFEAIMKLLQPPKRTNAIGFLKE